MTPEFLPTRLKPEQVFVFGSNLAGRHGKGAALTAFRYHGAAYGQGRGLAGQSYALPTKDMDLRKLTLDEIGAEVIEFLQLARKLRLRRFLVTRLGTGNAGYMAQDMAELFSPENTGFEVPPNVALPEDWWPHL